MRQSSLTMSIAAVLALSLSGCLGQGESDPAASTEGSPAESPVAAAPTADPSPADGTIAQSATPPSPPAASVATLPRDLDLIPSTNPDQRIQSVQKERSDPFSVVPTTPSVEIEILDDGTDSQPAPSGATPPGTGQAAGPSGGQPAGGRTAPSGGGSVTAAPNPVATRPTTPTIAPPPPPPQPTLARAVAVLGVVQIGSVPYAIVSAPNEPTSRYVREGQRLSNGQIVVRRIEMNGPTPTVVFEQFGIEVITAVGEGGAPETPEEAPAAVLPANNSQQPG